MLQGWSKHVAKNTIFCKFCFQKTHFLPLPRTKPPRLTYSSSSALNDGKFAARVTMTLPRKSSRK
jgi:hypothetical protein